MRRFMSLPGHAAVALMLASAATAAQGAASTAAGPLWLGIGVGGARVKSLAPAPAAGSGGIAGTLEVGYRITTRLGFGLEVAGFKPLQGCAEWNCGASAADFAPISAAPAYSASSVRTLAIEPARWRR